MNVSGERILIFGDSLSHHGDDNAIEIWPVDQDSNRSTSAPGDLLASLLLEQGAQAVLVDANVGRSAINFWSGGARHQFTSAEGLIATDQQFAPTKVIVFLGTNDLGMDQATDQSGFQAIKDSFQGAQVIAIGPPIFADDTLNAQAETVYGTLRSVFGSSSVIDARPLSSTDGRARDGIHFGASAASDFAYQLITAVKSAGGMPLWQMLGLGVLGVGLAVVAGSWWHKREARAANALGEAAPDEEQSEPEEPEGDEDDEHGEEPEPTEAERAAETRDAVHWYAKKYGITPLEARKLVTSDRAEDINHEIELWRAQHGFPAPNSPLVRGLVQEKIRGLGWGFAAPLQLAAPSEPEHPAGLPPEVMKKWASKKRAYLKALKDLEAGSKDIDPARRALDRLRKMIDEAAGHAPGSYKDPMVHELSDEFDALPKISDAADKGSETRVAGYQAESKRLKEEEREARAHLPSDYTKLSGLGDLEAPKRPFKHATTDPATMTPAQINKELDKLSEQDSVLGQEMIDAGRGHERPSEYLKMEDALSKELLANFERRWALRNEIESRYGPGAPSRMPPGFKRRKEPEPKVPKFTTLSWFDPSEPDETRRNREGSYPTVDVDKMLTQLRERGVKTVFVNDREVSLDDGKLSGPRKPKKSPELQKLEEEKAQIERALDYAGLTREQVTKYLAVRDDINARIKAL